MKPWPLHATLALALSCAAGAAAAGEFVTLRMRVTPDGHELLGARRFQAPQATAAAWNVSTGSPLGWQMLDSQGKVLWQGGVDDPRILRGPLEPGGGHAIVVRPSAEYILRVPADARATDLQLQRLAPVPEVSGGQRKALNAQGETTGVPAQRLDLRGVTRNEDGVGR